MDLTSRGLGRGIRRNRSGLIERLELRMSLSPYGCFLGINVLSIECLEPTKGRGLLGFIRRLLMNRERIGHRS